MRSLQPLGNHVLVRPVQIPERSAGGIHLPEQAREHSGEGVVLAVGEGKLDAMGVTHPILVKPGDKIAYTWLHGRDVKVNGDTLKLLEAEEIHGIITDTP